MNKFNKYKKMQTRKKQNLIVSYMKDKKKTEYYKSK